MATDPTVLPAHCYPTQPAPARKTYPRSPTRVLLLVVHPQGDRKRQGNLCSSPSARPIRPATASAQLPRLGSFIPANGSMGHVMPDARWTMKRASTSQRSFGSVTDYRTRVMLLAPPDRARGGGIKTLAGSPVVATKQALGLNN